MMAGAGLTYEDVSMLEMDWMPFAMRAGDEGFPYPLDSIRAYRAKAPGAFAYVQGRWLSGGLILNTGMRAEYFTAGDEARHQTLPGDGRGVWSLAPRLGIAYPISVRDVFSLAYVRVHQAPGRDFLYDQRTAISDRQPLGNPALEPAELISYEAAVKHLFGPAWALQTSVFFRDVFGQVGAFDAAIPEGVINLRYDDQDESHTLGFEWSLIHAAGERRRIEIHYVWLTAWGNESRPEGDPYGPVRSGRLPSVNDRPVSWDRRHSFLASGTWPWRESWSLSWSTALSSPLPWTPKPRRAPLTDLAAVNSRRLDWTEDTNVNVEWTPRHLGGLGLGLEVRNLFDNRSEHAATLDGYPNPTINTVYDDYGAYRTATGLGGGAYWLQLGDQPGDWVPVHDPRLLDPPRTVRASVGASW
jgi:outer membrane receptor protein involved in Fe transport